MEFQNTETVSETSLSESDLEVTTYINTFLCRDMETYRVIEIAKEIEDRLFYLYLYLYYYWTTITLTMGNIGLGANHILLLHI